MLNKFTDGISGLKSYVNSPNLGRNQAALHIAVKSNTAFAVSQVLNAGGDPLGKDEAGNTPLHLAAFNGAYVSLQTILEHESISRIRSELVSAANNEGDTPIHSACKGTNEYYLLTKIQSQGQQKKAPQMTCIELLLDHGSSLTTKNTEGHLPIQCVIMSPHSSIHAIDMLLEHDPDQIDVVDSAGNGLLHHARGQKVVQCLVHHKVNTTMLNNKGETALHKVVLGDEMENPLDQLIALILNGVDVDVVDGKGHTALQCLAKLLVKQGSNREHLMKALVVLGGDLNRKNGAGKTVYDIAKGESCRSTMKLLSSVGADDDKFLNCKEYPPISPAEIEASLSHKKPRKRGNWDGNQAAVLALDGGGIRGLLLLQMLLDIERRTGLSTKQLYDWIGGTSTGSMIVMGMTYSDMTLRDIQRLYFSLKDEVFKGGRPYTTEIMEQFMKDSFSEDKVMSCRQFPRIIVPATIADCRPCKLHLFKNFGFRTENDCPPPHLQKVWEATRSSSAAPTYFTPHKRFIDGGLMANNPTIALLTEMHECNQDYGRLGHAESASPVTFTEGLMRAMIGEDFSTSDQVQTESGFLESRPVCEGRTLVKDVKEEPTKPFIVMSFGTGMCPEVSVKDYNVSKVEGALGAGRFLLGVKEFAETIVEQCAATDGAIVLGGKAWCESIGSYYFRFQPRLAYDMKMDEKDNKNLISALWEIQCFVYDLRDQYEKVSDLLMSAF